MVILVYLESVERHLAEQTFALVPCEHWGQDTHCLMIVHVQVHGSYTQNTKYMYFHAYTPIAVHRSCLATSHTAQYTAYKTLGGGELYFTLTCCQFAHISPHAFERALRWLQVQFTDLFQAVCVRTG